MGTLVITRTKQYANSIRRCSIRINGSHAAYIKHGETISLPVADGDQEVVAKMDWCGSKPLKVNVQPGSTTQLRTGCYATGWRLLFGLLYVIVPGWYLYVEPA